MLNPQEVANLVRERTSKPVSVKTVYGWIKTRKLKAKKIGGMVLVHEAEVEIFLSKNCLDE